MGFPEQLKRARLSMNYTQQQVADLMGVTKSTYCGYETGKRQPDVAKIKQLACILNTSGDVLLETGFEQEPLFENETTKSNNSGIVLSELHQTTLTQLEKMNGEQIKASPFLSAAKIEFMNKIQKMPDDEIIALLAFANSLESVKQSFSMTETTNQEEGE